MLCVGINQGCQICLGATGKIYQMTLKYTQWPQNIPNYLKIYQMTLKYAKWPQNIPNDRKIDPMALKYTNNFQYKTLQNLPKLGFLV
jgi:hypothetical protein